eukprot:TRINITY_DN3163_c0_g1_i1.p1 TRINITY_DN3163_c0_g1~~TRINITY_DN3163_c0_g1_i1.p1  ORF type:complete len:76 (+),score=5.97 TRINITY_DN3163_c0_g1_i1:105-332(+)
MYQKELVLETLVVKHGLDGGSLFVEKSMELRLQLLGRYRRFLREESDAHGKEGEHGHSDHTTRERSNRPRPSLTE